MVQTPYDSVQKSELLAIFMVLLDFPERLLGSNLDRVSCPRVGLCGLEILGRRNRDTKEKDRDTE